MTARRPRALLAAAALLASLPAACSEAERGDEIMDRETTDAVEGQLLAGRVEDAIESELELGAYDIEAEGQERTVVLRGTVGSGSQRERAGAIARGVEGVETVRNRIVLAEEVERETESSTPSDAVRPEPDAPGIE